MDAERYKNARPYIHPTAMNRIRSFIHNDTRVLRALDVGCGTGQSTIVLSEIAESVVGLDPSADMLAHSLHHADIKYIQSSAENTPFIELSFDLITVAQAFHWLDHNAFLLESSRLLQQSGWLMIYTSWFTGEMKGASEFAEWFKNDYLARYPSPPRDRTPVTEVLDSDHGFEFRGEEEFFDEIEMSIDRFIDYQLSTTNVIAAIRQGKETYEAVGKWIKSNISSFYSSVPERTFLFNGKIWYLQKR